MSSYRINNIVVPDEGIGLGLPVTAAVPTPVRIIEETPTLMALARFFESLPLILAAAKDVLSCVSRLF